MLAEAVAVPARFFSPISVLLFLWLPLKSHEWSCLAGFVTLSSLEDFILVGPDL